ncbi:hypothetical protein COO91_00476 [Nostoc flagelliforme CCNUN1]|uniref:Uncharacterized protein n=1 Tax=Nostoc flagelliforme CCNUN1 TaxID=2038116 RepID=A0A2K8SGU1_9NOSO|nr:hypothetical protein COO91_00476 [Nostoc flagelliforme CCNUN1]
MGHWAWGIGHGALVINSCPSLPLPPHPPHSLPLFQRIFSLTNIL